MRNYRLAFDEENMRENFKIANQRFSYDQDGKCYLNDSLFITDPKDSVMEFEVYGDRYLFITYKLRENSPTSIPLEMQPKGRVRVYDLKRSNKFWDFNFRGYNSFALRWFKPKKGKIKLVKENIFVATN